MVTLTADTLARLNCLFNEDDRAEAVKLLSEDCTAKSMYLGSCNDAEVERCHFAALKLSNGSLEALIQAVALAQTDYRDLLMAANFGEDIHAHLNWMPE